MNKSRNRLYRIWSNMKDRTTNPNSSKYKHYGGRGISVCPEWFNDFETFYVWAITNGYNDDLTIDRIDNDGNYEPTNCQWADMNTQANNKRSNIKLQYRGETLTLMQWCRKLKLDYPTIRSRIIDGKWSAEKAFETPIRADTLKDKKIRISREQYLLQEKQKTEERLKSYIQLKIEQPLISNRLAAKILGFSEGYIRKLKKYSLEMGNSDFHSRELQNQIKISLIKECLQKSPNSSVREISLQTGISKSSVQRFLTHIKQADFQS